MVGTECIATKQTEAGWHIGTRDRRFNAMTAENGIALEEQAALDEAGIEEGSGTTGSALAQKRIEPARRQLVGGGGKAMFFDTLATGANTASPRCGGTPRS